MPYKKKTDWYKPIKPIRKNFEFEIKESFYPNMNSNQIRESVNLELSDSIGDSIEKILKKDWQQDFGRYSLYVTLTFKDLLDYNCEQCVEQFYMHGKPVSHWHNPSYKMVNEYADELSRYFPQENRLIVVEGNKDFKKSVDARNDAQKYLKEVSGAKAGDQNYKMLTQGYRPHIHGLFHGYTSKQFTQLLRHSKYMYEQIVLKPVLYCECDCCKNFQHHEHKRSLIRRDYYDEYQQKMVNQLVPQVTSTRLHGKCHLYEFQPRGWYKAILVDWRNDVGYNLSNHKPDMKKNDIKDISTYLYKYLFKGIMKSLTHFDHVNLKGTYAGQEEFQNIVNIY